jgi:hypothetical protein
MKATLDLSQTVTIVVAGGALVYAVVLVLRAIAELRAGQKHSDKKARRWRRPY